MHLLTISYITILLYNCSFEIFLSKAHFLSRGKLASSTPVREAFGDDRIFEGFLSIFDYLFN